MSTIKSNFKLKRSLEMENAAVFSIVGLFTDSREETAKKSPREIMALVLLTMKDACQTFPSTDETEEHLMLLHANQYFDKLIQSFESSEPLPVVIVGNTYDDMISNLRKIKQAAAAEEYTNDIIKRIDFFISACNKQYNQVAANRKKMGCVLVPLAILAFVGVILVAETNVPSWLAYIIIFGFVALAGIFTESQK